MASILVFGYGYTHSDVNKGLFMNVLEKLIQRPMMLFIFAIGMSSPFEAMANTTAAGNPIALMDRVSTTESSDIAANKRITHNSPRAKAAYRARAKARAARERAIKSAGIAQEEATNFIDTPKLNPTPNTLQDTQGNSTSQSNVNLLKVENSGQLLDSLAPPTSHLQKAVTTQPASP
jgi:hypothetical protein